jgi:hypothetical protein
MPALLIRGRGADEGMGGHVESLRAAVAHGSPETCLLATVVVLSLAENLLQGVSAGGSTGVVVAFRDCWAATRDGLLLMIMMMMYDVMVVVGRQVGGTSC